MMTLQPLADVLVRSAAQAVGMDFAQVRHVWESVPFTCISLHDQSLRVLFSCTLMVTTKEK